MNKILFDANSTSTTSATLYVAPGSCILINGWNFAAAQVAEVFRLLVEPGSIPGDVNGSSCSPTPSITPSQIIQEDPYLPCAAPVLVGQTATQDISSIVLSQPGFYNLHLTPAALGTAFVEAVFLTGEDACQQAASTCCCEPQLRWSGTSASPCLSITPGGPLGNEPVFDLDPCCVLQQIVTPVVPLLTDTIVVLQGGACGRATLQDVVDLVFVCGTLGTFPLQPFAAGDTVVALDVGLNCKRLDLAAAVTGLETPWTGSSLNPNLTIVLAGVNGHAPVFDYDLCADLSAFPSCSCEPVPGDLVPIIQGGNCVLATWPVVDLCAQIGLLTLGAVIGTDLVPVREAGGACKVVLASDLTASIAFPLLAPDGSCASPTYSFTSSPDSGMFYTGTAVRISDDNCADFIDVGASINLVSLVSNITLSAGAGSVQSASATFAAIATLGATVQSNAGDVSLVATLGEVQMLAATNVEISTASVLRLRFDVAGAWQLAGNAGLAGQVITSAGPGLPPVWAAASATVTFPLLAPTAVIPQYSFVAQPGMGMAMDGGELHFGSLDTVSPAWPFSSRLSIDTGVTGDMRLYGSRGDGSRGANVLVHGGDAINPGIQVEGGTASLVGGNSNQSNGGNTFVLAGSSSGGGTGGDAIMVAGNGVTGTAGTVSIIAGASGPAAPGGNIRMRTNHLNVGSPAAITMDHHGSVQYGDPYVFASQAHASAASFWYGVAGEAAVTKGQDIRIWGGPGSPLGGGGHGGHLHFMGGAATGGPANNGGDILLEGGLHTGAGIRGTVQLQRLTVAPAFTPTLPGGAAGYAPFLFVDDGTLRLFGWRASDSTWRSVLLT